MKRIRDDLLSKGGFGKFFVSNDEEARGKRQEAESIDVKACSKSRLSGLSLKFKKFTKIDLKIWSSLAFRHVVV